VSQTSPYFKHSISIGSSSDEESDGNEVGSSSLERRAPPLSRGSTIYRLIEAPRRNDTESRSNVGLLGESGGAFTDFDHVSMDDSDNESPALHANPSHISRPTQISQLMFPKSYYTPCAPQLPLCRERAAVEELLDELDHQSSTSTGSRSHNTAFQEPLHGDDFVEFELSNFVVYLPPSSKWHGSEMRGLQFLTTKAHPSFLFDGILRAGNKTNYVQGVPFEICSIGNYGEDVHEVGSNIVILTNLFLCPSI